jgi:hypothetical protein
LEDDMKAIGAIFVGLVGLCACVAEVTGDGHAKTEARATTPFHAVDAETSLDVVVTRGDTPSLVVTTDDNLVGEVVTEVVDGTLRITEREDLATRVPSVIQVTAPSLDSATNGGSGSMRLSGFSAATLAVRNSGSGELLASLQAQTLAVASTGSGAVTLEGDADHLQIDLDGSGWLDATKVVAHGADVELTGSGSLSLAVSGDSRLETTGSGSIDAHLDDGSAWLSATGSGSIRWTGSALLAGAHDTGSGEIVHH